MILRSVQAGQRIVSYIEYDFFFTDMIHDLKSEETRLKLELERSEAENDRLMRDLERAKDTAEELQDTTAANIRMSMQMRDVQGEQKRMRRELERVCADKAELEDCLQDANSSYNKLKMDLDLMNDNIIGLQRSLVAAESERSLLWDRLAQAQRDKEHMMEELILTAEEFESI